MVVVAVVVVVVVVVFVVVVVVAVVAVVVVVAFVVWAHTRVGEVVRGEVKCSHRDPVEALLA